MNKPVYVRFSILELSIILIYQFWYDNVNPKYSKKTKLRYMDTDSFNVYIKTDNIYQHITEDVETTFDSSNYETEITKRFIGL